MGTNASTGNFSTSLTYPRTIFDAFSFSFQTTMTIGYGFLNPSSLYINVIAYLQAFVGLIMNSAIAAVVYARIFTPTKLRNSIIFSSFAVVNSKARVLDEDTFAWKTERVKSVSFRMINARHRYVCMPSLRLFVHLRTKTGRDRPYAECTKTFLFVFHRR